MMETEFIDAPVFIHALGQPEEWPSQPASGSKAPSSLSTAEKALRAEYAIHRLFESGHPVCVAYSAGKDSSVMLSLVLNAARSFKASGGEPPLILVTHANTGIENPAFQIVARAEIARIEEFSRAHGLPVRVDVAGPTLNDSWAVRIISGRAIPTFANSPTRDCSIVWKKIPQERQRKLALKDLAAAGEPVVLVGTRFDESGGRAARMAERGESDLEIWLEEVRDKDGKALRIERRLSPIAHWSQEDVWVYLREIMDGERESYTDAKDVWEAYQDGGNSACAVVADDAMKAGAKACGARFGCALCTAVGRDKSLEAMLEADPKYAYLRGLNRLQRFLVETQNDWERRNWLGRTIDKDGFIAIEPDTYSPEMTRELLRYALTVDLDERLAAASLGIPPRFELISQRQLIAIDAIWSCQGYHERPFEAVKIWLEVHRDGMRAYPPPIDSSGFKEKKPARRYLHVGNWEDREDGGSDSFTGLRDLVGELAGVPEQGGCIGTRTLSDGRVVMDMPRSDMFEVDEEGAAMFFAFEAERVIEVYHGAKHPSPTEAYRYYVRLGTISTSTRHLHEIDSMMRRTSWKLRHGVYSMSKQDLIALSVSQSERAAGRRAPGATLSEMHRATQTHPFHARARMR